MDVTLREHLVALMAEQDKRNRQRFDAQESAVAAALTAADRAVAKAEVAAEKRFDSVNEFRAQLADQAATFMPRAESEIRFAAMQEKLDSVVTSVTLQAGAKDGSASLAKALYALSGFVLGLVGIAITIVTLV